MHSTKVDNKPSHPKFALLLKVYRARAVPGILQVISGLPLFFQRLSLVCQHFSLTTSSLKRTQQLL